MVEFFADAKNWVLLGLLAFLGILAYFGIHKLLLKALDDRASAIQAELAHAEALRKEADALLKQYAGRKEAAEAEAKTIVAQAKADAESLRQAAEKQLAQDLSRRERQMEERIARAESQAQSELRNVAAEAAIAAAERLLRGEDGATAHAGLMRQGVRELADRFG
ncbi:MAG: ATP F0F1 synthase subunit B [Caulobacterales bacterium]|jgi:F-type H+-transporting ATPase subunit b